MIRKASLRLRSGGSEKGGKSEILISAKVSLLVVLDANKRRR